VSKSAKAFRTITEVAEILELPAHVLRFWESKFKYIKPMKRGGGRRYYRPEDISLLIGIKHLLYSDGLTIKGAQKVIKTNGVKATAQIGLKKIIDINPNSPPAEIMPSSVDIGRELLPNKRSPQQATLRGINFIQVGTLLSRLERIRDRIKIRTAKKTVA
jgi:DNA-binding transcriptional MerR regulator